ncbi:hypothetical protein [Lysinibacillus xylanilyticus]|uniref:hypothetical protein n=1 Tax=Lysinibacillus xylanilyticus TaxID=582475 RepID=UPI003D092E2B
MFNEQMGYEEMDRILRRAESAQNLTAIELADRGILTEEDIELFFPAYLEYFNFKEEDLNNVKKVGQIIFDLSSKLQAIKTKKFF